MTHNTYAQDWLKQIKQKYKGKILTASQGLEFRNELVEKYGKNIIPGMPGELTGEEKFARKEYEILSEQLHEVAPDIKKYDKQELDLFKTQDLLIKLYKFTKNALWIILPILILLAVIKYLLS